jgi:hypothetical protein
MTTANGELDLAGVAPAPAARPARFPAGSAPRERIPAAWRARACQMGDVALVPGVALAAALLGTVRRLGFRRLPRCRRTLLRLGVLPLRHHFSEPLCHPDDLRRPLDAERALPGIDWNEAEQLRLLEQMRFSAELGELPREPTAQGEFYLDNHRFGAGDAEYLYNLLRLRRPRRIVEVGCGFSSLIIRRALEANAREEGTRGEHVCIEPYKNPWLESVFPRVVRERIEDVDPALWETLGPGDVFFIDSSHVIRPQGDVVVQFLQILPRLPPGVLVHVHDIFSPRDYPARWVVDELRLWSEQYLLEAFLSGNREWRILGALNWLKHHHLEPLARACPFLRPETEPGSFWIERIG